MKNYKRILTGLGTSLLLFVATAFPALAVTNGKIVFMAMQSQTVNVGIMNADGSNYHLLTNDNTSGYPSITPNGQKIIYAKPADGVWPMYAMNSDGTNVTSLGISGYYGGAISNTKISYYDDSFSQRIANLDGSDSFATGFSPSFEGVANVSALSPDGQKKAYPIAEDDNIISLYLSNLDGSSAHKLNTVTNAIVPTFSPDGQKVYFIGSEDGEALSLYSVDVDGSNEHQLTSLPSSGYLEMAPDGSKLLLAIDHGEEDGTEIDTVNPNGSNLHPIVQNIMRADNPSSVGWSPDSSKILYQEGVSDSNIDIFSVNADGSNPTNLTNTADVSESYLLAHLVWASAASANATTLSSAETAQSILLSTPEGTEITCSSSAKAAAQAKQDTQYNYPFGLVNFCFNTESADNEVSLTFVTDLKPGQVTARKYNSIKQAYSDISGATIAETTLDGQHALKLTYTITDNGPLDLNPQTGKITDPVGLAVQESELAGTGQSQLPLYILAILILATLPVGIYSIGQKVLR